MLSALISFCVTSGLLKGDGIDAFKDETPNSPDSVVSFIEYNGYGSAFILTHTRKVQVSVRDKSSYKAKMLATSIYNSFKDYPQLKIAGRSMITQPLSLPVKIKIDEKGRVYYAFNMNVLTYTD